MLKRIEERDNILSTRMVRICSSYLRQKFDFVACSLGITRSRLDHFESGVAVLARKRYFIRTCMCLQNWNTH